MWQRGLTGDKQEQELSVEAVAQREAWLCAQGCGLNPQHPRERGIEGRGGGEGEQVGDFLNQRLSSPHVSFISTKPNPNQIISVGSKPGMNGAGFQKGLTCESCHSEFQGGTGLLGMGGRRMAYSLS